MPSVTTTFSTFGTAARSGSLGGSESWGTPANAQTVNAVRATYSRLGPTPWTGYTFYLTAQALTQKVPDGTTIDGVRATVTKRKSTTGTGTWVDSAVYLMKGGAVQTVQNKATATAYTTTDASESYGGPTDNWGLILTSADVNGAGFGVAVSCGVSGMSFGDTDVPEIDAVTVEVFYSQVGGAGSLMLTGTGD